MGLARRLLEALPAVAAVGTLPIGILTAIFVGGQAAAVVFVVGWLLLVPLGGVINEEVLADESESEETTDAADPVVTLRERYAAGEIDDVEFERRLEEILATEDVEVPPEVDVEPADGDGDDDGDAGDVERELERERE
ncbi:hypothetical protein BRD18_04695 [Halobacteriales archaeon SW_7_71_33]|nr:MAG: hypothetical protein BRD18_04695 [Halobacteriales archaeon SW_7_71_33]